MSSSVAFISEDRVASLLTWNDTFEAVKAAMRSVTDGRAVQQARSFTEVLQSDNVLLTMPGYLQDSTYGALACKLVTAAPGNHKKTPPMPNILANITLFDEHTGELKAVVAGTEITTWRTAAASAVATKYLHDGTDSRKPNKVLAVLGAGVQGRIHAKAFQHFFKFDEVRIWNHNVSKATLLAEELNLSSCDKEFQACASVQDCVNAADVIVTATAAPSPFLKHEWVKRGVHINAVGAGAGHHHSELEEAIYKAADVYIDHWEGARSELAGLGAIGIQFRGEIGGLIRGTLPQPHSDRITVFQSLGMAVEDCAVARMIYDLHRARDPII